MNHKFSTPKSLAEVVERIVCYRPLEGMTIDEHTRAAFRDYLSQKFGVAYLNAASPEELERLERLWRSITQEQKRTP